MSRMKDIVGSHKSYEEDKKNDKNVRGIATFSNLSDIRKNLHSNNLPDPQLQKQAAKREETEQKPLQESPSKADENPTPVPQENPPEEKTEKPTPPPAQPKQEKSLPDDPVQISRKLYKVITNILKSYKTQIDANEKIDINKLLPYIPKFVKYTLEEDELLILALHPGRSTEWFSSHSINTAIIAIEVGHGLDFNRKQLYALALATLLHDVGMLKISPVILSKPGKFTEEERHQLRNHPNYGAEILQHLSSKYPFIIKTMLEEHEKWDGTGYPNGLKGEEITPFARILAIADKFESLVHERNYRPGYKPPAAIQKLIQEHQNDFDPKILKAFINIISMYPVGSHVLLNNGQIARVMSVNKNRPVRPLVKVITNSEGKKISDPYILNMEKEPLTYITKSINYLH